MVRRLFAFQAFDYGGDYTLSAVLNGVETLSQQIVVAPDPADASRSSLTSELVFGGLSETDVLTLTDRDSSFGLRSGDAVGWDGDGFFLSSTSPNGEDNNSYVVTDRNVTDANGVLAGTFLPAFQGDTVVVHAHFDNASVAATVNSVWMVSWSSQSGGDWDNSSRWDLGGLDIHVVPTADNGVWLGLNVLASL